jgi:phosphatidylglycerol lysyltransferase
VLHVARLAGSRRLHNILGALAGVTILGVALWFLHSELQSLSAAAVVDQIRSIAWPRLLAAALFVALSYMVLTGYDIAGGHYLGREIPVRRAALTAFLAYAIGNNVGLAALSGGSVRYRMYSLIGFGAGEIATLIAFCAVTFALGASLLIGVAILAMPGSQFVDLGLSAPLLHSVAAILILAVAAYLLVSHRSLPGIRIGNWYLPMPLPVTAWSQVGLSVADLALAAASLYVLLAPELDIGFLPFLGIYLLGMALGIVSNVPGGIGVFEAILLAALPQVDRGTLLGTIIVYRAIYYLAPLALALVLLTAHEIRQHRKLLQRSAEQAGAWLSGIAPQVVGAAVFLAGAVSVVAASLPEVERRHEMLARFVPLAGIEVAHLAGTGLGVAMLLLAHGLISRLRSAHSMSCVLLAAAIAVCFLKGPNYEEALLLTGIFIVLWAARDEFYRQGSIATKRFAPAWIAAIVVVLAAAVLLGLVSHQAPAGADRYLWPLGLGADAPRWWRSIVVVAAALAAFAAWKLWIARHSAAVPIDFDLQKIRVVLAQATHSSSNLVLLSDKRLLWSASRNSFLMYQLSGRSWIAMGGPVGDPAEDRELVWSFTEMVDRNGGRPVFYQVSDTSLTAYVDMGLTLTRLGEAARVPLEDFSLEGSRRGDLRESHARSVRDGASFEVIPRAAVPRILNDLRRVSDGWLKDTGATEKAFSLGSFSESYVANFDCAVVRIDSRIVAFTNLWGAPAGAEVGIDLLRFDAASKDAMDYLLIETILWARQQNWQWLNLGMTPLEGLEKQALAPLWHRLGHLIFSHGENFYNFQALRQYKEKFDPDWQARYIACRGGWFDLPAGVLDATRLISGDRPRIVAQ